MKKARTLLDRLLSGVKYGKKELTFDVEGYSPEQVSRISKAAKSKGLNVSGTNRWLLIRDLKPKPVKKFTAKEIAGIKRRAEASAARDMRAALKTPEMIALRKAKPELFR